MKNKWYIWLIYAGIWVVAGVVNYFEGRDNYYLFQIIVFLLLAPCQFICDKHGEKGRKVFKYICIVTIALCLVYLAAVIFSVFN